MLSAANGDRVVRPHGRHVYPPNRLGYMTPVLPPSPDVQSGRAPEVNGRCCPCRPSEHGFLSWFLSLAKWNYRVAFPADRHHLHCMNTSDFTNPYRLTAHLRSLLGIEVIHQGVRCQLL